jgi:hypothetical protein
MDVKAELFPVKGLIPPEGVQMEEWLPLIDPGKNRNLPEE